MFMDIIDFLNGRGEVVIFSTDERNLFSNNLTYGPVVFGSRRLFAATLWTTTEMFTLRRTVTDICGTISPRVPPLKTRVTSRRRLLNI